MTKKELQKELDYARGEIARLQRELDFARFPIGISVAPICPYEDPIPYTTDITPGITWSQPSITVC